MNGLNTFLFRINDLKRRHIVKILKLSLFLQVSVSLQSST